MLDYKTVVFLCLGIFLVFYLQVTEDNLKRLKIQSEIEVQKEVARTEYLEQTQKNVLEAYSLGYATASDKNKRKE